MNLFRGGHENPSAFDFAFQPSLKKRDILELATGNFFLSDNREPAKHISPFL
jgi:hypothetical protein